MHEPEPVADVGGRAVSTDRPPVDDAIHRDPAASYDAAAAATEVDEVDRAVVSSQLGRPARGRPAVVHRCRYGLPTVVRVDPRLGDGTPFPTTFWLTCPVLRSLVGRLEGEHRMVECNDRLAADEELAAEYADAHRRYVAFRDALGGRLPGDPGAGGMPRHVKCLHVHAAHALATDDNPIGRWTLEQVLPAACPGPCVGEDEIGERLRDGRDDDGPAGAQR